MALLIGLGLALSFTYPFWGLALLLWLCKVCAVTGPLLGRLLVAAIVAGVVTLILTPVYWGTEVFSLPIPWYFGFMDWALARYDIASSLSIYAIAFVANFVFSLMAPATPQKVQPRRR